MAWDWFEKQFEFKKLYGEHPRFKVTESDYRFCCARYWNDCILEIEQRKKQFSLESKGRFLEFNHESLCENPNDILVRIADFFGVDSNGFCFDLSRVASQNYKVANYEKSEEGAALLDVISPGMKLKGYSI